MLTKRSFTFAGRIGLLKASAPLLAAAVFLMPSLLITKAEAQRPLSVHRLVAFEDVPPAASESDFVPQGLPLLAQHASWHTDLTFDRSMLALAGKLEGLDEPTREAIARLNAVSVHSFRYAEPGRYDLAEVDSIRAQYDALGWKHVVTRHGHVGAGQTIAPGRTDVWIHLNGMNVAGVAVLLAEPSSLNLVAVHGDISTVDLLRLRGHFGIPRFDTGDLR